MSQQKSLSVGDIVQDRNGVNYEVKDIKTGWPATYELEAIYVNKNKSVTANEANSEYKVIKKCTSPKTRKVKKLEPKNCPICNSELSITSFNNKQWRDCLKCNLTLEEAQKQTKPALSSSNTRSHYNTDDSVFEHEFPIFIDELDNIMDDIAQDWGKLSLNGLSNSPFTTNIRK